MASPVAHAVDLLNHFSNGSILEVCAGPYFPPEPPFLVRRMINEAIKEIKQEIYELIHEPLEEEGGNMSSGLTLNPEEE